MALLGGLLNLDGLLGGLLGSSNGQGTSEVVNVSNAAALNTEGLVDSMIGGMDSLINTTLDTTFNGVHSLVESTVASSACAMNSVAESAIAFTEQSATKVFDGNGNLISESATLSTAPGAEIMQTYAAETLGPLTAGVGNGIDGMLSGVGEGAGQAMANLGSGVPEMLPGTTSALGADIVAASDSGGLVTNLLDVLI